jgi:nicotinamide riboside kinase
MDDSDQDIINEQPTIEPIQSPENILETIAALRSDISLLLERVTQLEADNERITEQLTDRTESGT